MAFQNQQVIAIIPALNEAASIGNVVSELKELSEQVANASKEMQEGSVQLFDHIIVCDNGSSDATAKVAAAAGAVVVNECRKGYGFACLRAIDHLKDIGVQGQDIVIFVDADNSVNCSEVDLLIDSLSVGNDLVIGNRIESLQEKQALGPHQRFGNELASFLIRKLWNQPVNDLGPFRAIRYGSLLRLDMQDQRFGWTVEMQVKAIQLGYSYAEVPVSTRKRVGKSKISGTVRGTIGAALGIFGKIFYLYLNQHSFRKSAALRRTQNRVQLP